MPDPFDLLGIPPRFDLSRPEIERAYLVAAATLHPDLSDPDQDGARSMAELNGARRTLEDPEARADSLLTRLGGPPAEKEKSLPGQFLAEMLEVREEIEAALSDAANRDRARSHWEAWARDRRTATIKQISGLFASLPPHGEARIRELRDIRVRLNEWRYVERLIEQLDPAQGTQPGM